MKWNPRFVAYANAHGKTPAAMMQHDEKMWPGGIMCGFIMWIREKILSFVEENPEIACCKNCAPHNSEFDKYLKSFSKIS